MSNPNNNTPSGGTPNSLTSIALVMEKLAIPYQTVVHCQNNQEVIDKCFQSIDLIHRAVTIVLDKTENKPAQLKVLSFGKDRPVEDVSDNPA